MSAHAAYAGPACAVVLAGGASSRMGRPKAWLEFHGEPLMARIVRACAQAACEVIVAAAPGQALPAVDARRVDDEHPGLGPLAGIEVGLRAARAERVFITSCDVPFLHPEVVRRLLAALDDADAAVLRAGERIHPLVASYRRSLAALASRLIAQQRLRPIFLLEEVRARILDGEAFRDVDPDLLSWENVNTPEDFDRALHERREVELIGLARLAVGWGSVAVPVPRRATVRDLGRALAARWPRLREEVLREDGVPREDHAFVAADRAVLRDPDAPVPEGRVCLITLPSGG
jgi:molybdopterin-guanine dinucleotide biosynthesis protein A